MPDNEMEDYEQWKVARTRAQQGKSLTGKQAKLLIEERDNNFRMTIGMHNVLMKLRAFLAKDAPQYAKDDIKAATDKNDAMIEEYWKFVEELGMEQLDISSIMEELTINQIRRIQEAAGSKYDGDAARPPITPVQVAKIVLRRHWDIATCFCPCCVLAREVMLKREVEDGE